MGGTEPARKSRLARSDSTQLPPAHMNGTCSRLTIAEAGDIATSGGGRSVEVERAVGPGARPHYASNALSSGQARAEDTRHGPNAFFSSFAAAFAAK